jgi:hypothetical protein
MSLNLYSFIPLFHLYGRNAGYPAPPVQSRTCSFPASGSSVVLASAVQSQAFRQTLSPVSPVSFGFVGYSPQGGWLLVLRSDGVRQQWPGRAPYFRHVLPRVVGFPHRRVRCVIRLPRHIQRAFPVTVFLRLPGACALVELRFQHCSVSGFPLPCLRSCIPSAPSFHAQECLGPPKCFDASLPACRGLRTPADLPLLAMSVGSYCLRER